MKSFYLLLLLLTVNDSLGAETEETKSASDPSSFQHTYSVDGWHAGFMDNNLVVSPIQGTSLAVHVHSSSTEDLTIELDTSSLELESESISSFSCLADSSLAASLDSTSHLAVRFREEKFKYFKGHYGGINGLQFLGSILYAKKQVYDAEKQYTISQITQKCSKVDDIVDLGCKLDAGSQVAATTDRLCFTHKSGLTLLDIETLQETQTFTFDQQVEDDSYIPLASFSNTIAVSNLKTIWFADPRTNELVPLLKEQESNRILDLIDEHTVIINSNGNNSEVDIISRHQAGSPLQSIDCESQPEYVTLSKNRSALAICTLNRGIQVYSKGTPQS